MRINVQCTWLSVRLQAMKSIFRSSDLQHQQIIIVVWKRIKLLDRFNGRSVSHMRIFSHKCLSETCQQQIYKHVYVRCAVWVTLTTKSYFRARKAQQLQFSVLQQWMTRRFNCCKSNDFVSSLFNLKQATQTRSSYIALMRSIRTHATLTRYSS